MFCSLCGHLAIILRQNRTSFYDNKHSWKTSMSSTVYQNVCKHIYQDPNPKVHPLPFTVNQWWNENCLRIHKTELCSIMYKLQEPLRWSSVPTSIMSTTRVRWGLTTCDVQEKVRRQAMQMLTPACRPTPVPSGICKDISGAPKDRTRAKHVAEPEARRHRCFPACSTQSRGIWIFTPTFPVPPSSQLLGSFCSLSHLLTNSLPLLQSLPRQPGTVPPCSEKTISPLLLDYKKPFFQ